MNDPTASAWVKGRCGDEMEFYLVVSDRRLVEVMWETTGCEVTCACAALVAETVCGRSTEEALRISAGEVLAGLPGIPREHQHCPILAVGTFYQAVADYLLKP